MKIREVLLEDGSIWRYPTRLELRDEYETEYLPPKRRWEERCRIIGARYPLFSSLDNFSEIVNNSDSKTISLDELHAIHNVSGCTTIEELKTLVNSYSSPRDVDAIVDGFKKGKLMSLPIVISGKTGSWILSGNTRLNVASILGIRMQAIFVRAPSNIRYT